MNPSVTLIINTAQQADYLDRVLRAVAGQTVHAEETVIAEDGTDAETRAVVECWLPKLPGRCRHFTQPKDGFRRARILNQAIVRSTADYVVFLDGDTVPHPDFVGDHRSLARRGFFVQGHRVLVKERESLRFGQGSFTADRRRALLSGQLQGLKHVYRWLAPFKRVLRHLDGVRGCNLGIWRSDLIEVNGYDERYVGWGCEDLDLAIRLIHRGTLRLDVRGRALCYHLWHPPADRSNLVSNEAKLAHTQAERKVRCEFGLNLHDPAVTPRSRSSRVNA